MKTSELVKLFKENGIILNRYGKKHDLYFSHKQNLPGTKA